MRHQLPRLRPARCQVHAIDDVIETTLEQLQERASGLTRHACRLAEIVLELGLVDAVVAAHLLLLAQLAAVLGNFGARLAGRLLTGSGTAPLDRAVAGEAAVAFEKELDLFAGFAGGGFAPAEPADRTGITRHRYTRRRFGGRQPLCGIGVTSLIIVISRPA